ncbi:MAG: hypothetical protein H0U59_00590 [Gemmatimonadaceae bacterium]|nr:hypothetical protein [Gemmatimonadaceae bacterium]
MSSTFKLVAQKAMGKMRPTHSRDLKRVEKRRAKLVAELEALDARQDEVVQRVIDHLQIDVTGPFRGLHLDDDGGVHALYCTCPPCQANLNSVSVEDATEALIERRFIHENEADHMRHRARLMDQQKGSVLVH